MTNSIRPRINLTLRTLALCVLASLLCSCAATSVKETWKTPDFHRPAGKIAVLEQDFGRVVVSLSIASERLRE